MKDKLPVNGYENSGLGSNMEGFLLNCFNIAGKEINLKSEFSTRRKTGKKEKVLEKCWNKNDWAWGEIQIEGKNG